jgi:AcrR family transcriptional regulator
VSKTSPEPSLSPRAARTRAALLAAGMELLVRRSVDAISIDELVAKAAVAKGSFFNHFADKKAFAEEIYRIVRGELEAAVTNANADVAAPLMRLSGGMIVAAGFALSKPKRLAVMVRTASGMTLSDHPLNAGVAKDLSSCVRSGVIRGDAKRSGVAFWIGCCQTLMLTLVGQRPSAELALELIADMLTLSLSGLGASDGAIAEVVDRPRLRAKLRASSH